MSKVADPLREYAEMLRRYHGRDIHGEERDYVTATTREILELAEQIDRDHELRMEQCRRETKRAFARYLRSVTTEYERGHKRKSWNAQQRMALDLEVCEYKLKKKEDGEEIVWCCDCKHAQPVDTKMVNAIVCHMWALNEEDGGEVAPMVEPDGFCKWGEPREEKS